MIIATGVAWRISLGTAKLNRNDYFGFGLAHVRLVSVADQGIALRRSEGGVCVSPEQESKLAAPEGELKILVSGATGLIGSALIPVLCSAQHEPWRLVRQKVRPIAPLPEIGWDPERPMPPELLQDFDAVIHLAGESIAKRWTADQKERIRKTRGEGTRNLCQGMAGGGANGPKVLLCASAIGYYGDRGDELLSENSSRGQGFLPEVTDQWEKSAAVAEQAGVRVVHLRFGVVLSPAGGALAKMLPPFRLGIGGKLGSGSQYMSWISLDDVVSAILFLLERPEMRGAFNIVAPNPAINAEFTRTLAAALHRPAILPVPAFALRWIFGEMGRTLLLGSQRVVPERLLEAGFRFRHPELREALVFLLQPSAISERQDRGR